MTSGWICVQLAGMDTSRVLVADPQRMFAQSLATALRTDFGFEVVDEYPADGADVLRVAGEHRLDVVLLEYWLEEMRAPATIRALLARQPRVTPIVVTWLPGASHVAETFKAGAYGVITKNEPVEHLVDGIHRAQAGEWPIFRQDLENLVGRIQVRAETWEQAATQFSSLAPRELKVLSLIGGGLHPQDIAKELGLTRETVRGYIRDILRKTGAQSQVELIALARDQGLL